MASALPHQSDRLFLTDGGLETVLLFHLGIDLPEFAAFTLLKDAEGERTLRTYFDDYLEVARRHRSGFLLEAMTWRASRDWGKKLGYSARELKEANQHAIRMLREIRDEHEATIPGMVVSGCVGPRGDGYQPGAMMDAAQSKDYHLTQIESLAAAGADVISAMTMNNLNEPVGIAHAAREVGIPIAISFTVETDGRLPGGEVLAEAIARVDEESDAYPAYYMINCAHPTHFDHALPEAGDWLERIGGVRANASTRSHAELDDATELDEGNPADLGPRMAALRAKLPNLVLLGGCCGTDHRHVAAIAEATLGG